MLLIGGLFLPLFPLSAGLNLLLARVDDPRLRALLLLVWPQLGIGLLALGPAEIPGWIMVWAVASSVLYAFRALAVRDLGVWAGYLASSGWALLWLLAGAGAALGELSLAAAGFSLPLMLLVLLSAGLVERFGAAYTGLYGGLALLLPRFSLALVLVVLAIMATPFFPSFFAMLGILTGLVSQAPWVAAGAGLSWLLWSWAGARLLQGLIVGTPDGASAADLSGREGAMLLAGLMILLVLALISMGGVA